MDEMAKYRQAMEQHNIATGQGSDENRGFWKGVSNSVSNIPNFTKATLASTGIGFVNTGTMVANIFRTEEAKKDYIDTQAYLNDMDSDLGKYYTENQGFIDTSGFILGSIVPGMGGVRTLNAAQKALSTARSTGMLGTNMSRATGLLVPQTEAYMVRAANQVAQSNLKHKVLHAETLKALGGGLHQNALEAAAFETFAMLAQGKSNFIDEMDAKDIVLNALTGVAIGGVVGGGISAIGIRRGIKDKVIALDSEGFAGRLVQLPRKGASPDLMISAANKNKASVEDFLVDVQGRIATESDKAKVAIYERHQQAAKGTLDHLDNVIMENARKISQTPAMGRLFGETIQGLPADQAAPWILGAKRLRRVGEVVMRRAKPAQLELDLGIKMGADEIASQGHVWHKLWGDGAEGVGSTTAKPAVTPLADKVKVRGVETMEEAMNRAAKSRKFTQKDPMDVTAKGLKMQDVQARYWWVENMQLNGKQTIQEFDLPMLEAALRDLEHIKELKVVSQTGETLFEGLDKASLQELVIDSKKRAISRMKAARKPPEVIAQYTNVRSNFLRGTQVSGDQTDNLFANQYWAKKNNMTTKELQATPQWMGVEVDEQLVKELNPLELEADLFLAQQLKAHQDVVDMAVANAVAPYKQLELDSVKFPGIKENLNIAEGMIENKVIQDAIHTANREGVGAGFFSSANANYGDLGSLMQRIGQIKLEMDKRGISIVKSEFDAVNRALLTDRAGAAELSAVNEMLAGKAERFSIDPRGIAADAPAGTIMQLRPLKVIDDVPGLPKALADDVINITNPNTATAIEKHIKLNGERVGARQGLRQAEGLDFNADPRSFYPIKPDPRKTPFHAMVKDSTSGGATRTTMIHAATAKDLDDMIRAVNTNFPEYHVITKGKSEEYFKAIGEFDYGRTLSELELDSTLATRGINSQLLPITEPQQVVDKFFNWHSNQVTRLNVDIVATKYAPEFETLTRLGQEFDNLSTSKFPDMTALALHTKENPYVEYVKTALNISNISDYAKLSTTNQALNSMASQAWNSAGNLFKRMKGVDQKVLDEINTTFNRIGYHTPFKDAESWLAANHTADSAVLSKFIRNAHSIVTTVFLRWDPLHSANNKLGSILMISTELRHLTKAAMEGDSKVAGKLAELTRIELPGFDGETILSPHKLIANAYRNWFSRPELRARAIQEGYIPSDISQAIRVVDDLSIRGTETAKQFDTKIAKAIEGAKKFSDFAESATGNKWAESVNRFVAYDVMRQMTDPLVEAGVMTAREAGSYINTFVGRTQVILNAAQRPMAFQGPAGMAMGLFQSYQFNLFQQLFRYIGDGAGRTAALMAGLQGSFYGMNGIPGFRHLNESVIALAPGNDEHMDISSGLTGALGKDMAEFLLYGPLGKSLNLALHSRGDLTPQHPTVLPTSPGDLPAVKIYTRMLSNMHRAFGNMAEGASLQETFLSALEHNSINRPLGGLAQVLRGVVDGDGQVKSTDSKRDFLAANDLWSLATMARLAGGKPLDEVVTRDFAYRSNAYNRFDQARRASAVDALRVSMLGGKEPSENLLESVFDIYLRTGGDPRRFNSFMLGQMERTSVPQADRLVQSLKSPYAYRLQQLIGGADID